MYGKTIVVSLMAVERGPYSSRKDQDRLTDGENLGDIQVAIGEPELEYLGR